MTAAVGDWTEERIAQLRSLWTQGLSASQIGLRIAKTRSAVLGKVHRLDLPPRPPPIKPHQAAKPLAAPPRPKPPRQAPKGQRPPRKTEPIPDAQALPAAPEPPRQGAGDGCAWPIGEPRRPGFRFCGAERQPGRSDCAGHVRIAYIGGGAAA